MPRDAADTWAYFDFQQKAQQNVLQEDVRVKKSGYLVKEGGATVRNWRKRWFVMSGNAISYSKTEEDLASLGTIYLEDVAAVERTDERPLQQNVFALRGHDKARTWYLSAASEEEMVAWMDAIKQAIAEEEALRATVRSYTFKCEFSALLTLLLL